MSLCALERKTVFSVLRGQEKVSRPASGKLSQDRLWLLKIHGFAVDDQRWACRSLTIWLDAK
jgi:hypothetical protein